MEAYLRHRSNSHIGSASPRPPRQPPSPTPAAAAAASSRSPTATSPPPPTQVKHILKRVESHVRLMAHLENISTSSSYTAVRLRQPATAQTAESSAPAAQHPQSQPGSMPRPGMDHLSEPLSQLAAATNRETSAPNSSSSSGASAGWSAPFAVTRVHRGTATAAFYDDVVAPCVANSIAGQSYLFLVSGPMESGRSQTLYGSPHYGEKGIVELAAEDLLRRIALDRALDERAGEEASALAEREGGEGPERTPNPTRARAAMHEESTASASRAGEKENAGAAPATRGRGILVTYSAFTTRGTQMLDSVTSEPIVLEDFPPPLGTVPLPPMQILTQAAKAVVIPARKYADTSCVIQFQVYAAVDGAGRRSMATLTFVDLAVFKLPLCQELRHLMDTVRAVTGEGGTANFRASKLTTLLEPALVGYVTLVSITTICGRPDLYDAACTALHFAGDLSRIRQVLLLTHITAPRWFFDTAQRLERLRARRAETVAAAYAKGVYDYYRTAAAWLERHVHGAEASLAALLEDTAATRTALAAQAARQLAELEQRVAKEQASCTAAVTEAQAAYTTNGAQLEALRRLDEAIATAEQQRSQNDLRHAHRLSEMRLEITALEATRQQRVQELQRSEKEAALYAERAASVRQGLARYAEDLQSAQLAHRCRHELQRIAQKRGRLEAELQRASQAAHRHTDTLRVDRERRSRLSRLTVMQQQVDSLRATVRMNAAVSGEGLDRPGQSSGATAAVLPLAPPRATQDDTTRRPGSSHSLPQRRTSSASRALSKAGNSREDGNAERRKTAAVVDLGGAAEGGVVGPPQDAREGESDTSALAERAKRTRVDRCGTGSLSH